MITYRELRDQLHTLPQHALDQQLKILINDADGGQHFLSIQGFSANTGHGASQSALVKADQPFFVAHTRGL